MKFRLAVIVIVLMPKIASAHTEIFFPKLFSPAELRTSGFVLLNPDPITATVNLYLVSEAGKVLSSADVTIPAGGQFARLGADLFPNATGNGWVYLLNDTEGMQAFWLTYNGELTSLDGAEAVSYDGIGADQVIPFVAGQAELNVINPNFFTVPFTIRLFGSNGALADAVTRTLPVAGAFQAQVSELFPAVDLAEARYLRIVSSSAAIASSALIRGFLVPVECVVVNGTNVSARNEFTFPHVINGNIGEANYTTILGITNVSTSSQSVTITFNSDIGSIATATRTINAGGSFRDTAQNLFGLTSGFQSGWVKVTGTAALVGFTGYADTLGGGFAVVSAGNAQTKLFFSHIADGPPQWQTGLALLNATDNAATADVYAVSPSGSLISNTRLTLEPGKKIARVIHELLPETLGVNGGFVFVSSTVPLSGIELFYTHDLKVLSNVAAGRLVPGVTYTPPTP